jgi:hypothetical protein
VDKLGQEWQRNGYLIKKRKLTKLGKKEWIPDR